MHTEVATGLSRAVASRWPAASRATPAADRPGHCSGPPSLGTWIVKYKRPIVAAGDLDATAPGAGRPNIATTPNLHPTRATE
jgi:hypothetical protein